MAEQKEFILTSIHSGQNKMVSQGLFAEFYDVNPNQISSISSDCFGSQSSRLIQTNTALYSHFLNNMVSIFEKLLKKRAVYEIASFKKASQSQIMVVATGLVKLRYTLERKIRYCLQTIFIKIQNHGKQGTKQKNKVKKMVQSLQCTFLRYYKPQLTRQTFQAIKQFSNDTIFDGAKILRTFLDRYTNTMLSKGFDEIKQNSKTEQKMQIFVDSIEFITNTHHTSSLRTAMQALKYQKQKHIGIKTSNFLQETLNQTTYKEVLLKSPPQTSRQTSILLPQKNIPDQKQIPKTNINNQEKTYIQSKQKKIKQSLMRIDLSEEFSNAKNKKSIEMDQCLLKNNNIQYQESSGIASSFLVETTNTVLPNNICFLSQQQLGSSNILNSPSFKNRQQKVNTPKATTNLNSRADSINSPHSIKASRMEELECKEVTEEYDIQHVQSKIQKVDQSQISIQSMKRATIFPFSTINSSQFKRNNIQKYQELQNITSLAYPKQSKKLEQQLQDILAPSKPFVPFKHPHGCLQLNLVEKPFQSFFFAKNHRSNNLYHRHPDLAYQQLGDLIDTPQIFYLPNPSVLSSNYSYQFRNLNSPKLAHVKSADNLFGIDKLQKSILINDYNPYSVQYPPITPTNDRSKEPRFSELPQPNKQKFDNRATSSGSYKLKKYSSGSQAFQEYLKQKQMSNTESNYYYSKADSVLSPSCNQGSKYYNLQSKVTGRNSQVSNFLPLVQKTKTDLSMYQSSPYIKPSFSGCIRSPFELSSKNSNYK